MKKVKNIIVYMLLSVVLIMLCIQGLSITVCADEIYDFENFTEDDAMDFIKHHNIEIPQKLLDWENLSSFTKNIIVQAYKNPSTSFGFNYSKTQKYAEDIRLVVCSYITHSDISTHITNSYVLRYNTVMDEYGNWVTSGGYYNPDWMYYNCYAYALNRCEMSNFYVNQHSPYDPGDMFYDYDMFAEINTLEELSMLVCKDLMVMGYSDIVCSRDIPIVNDMQELICLRFTNYDYHFMRYDIETDAWYHKPGNSAILKYNYVPSIDIDWKGERSFEGNEERTPVYYQGDIIFIQYSKNIIDTTPNSSQNIFIQPNKDVFYEVNINEADHYRLKLIAGYEMDYELYDSNFDIVVSDSGNNNVDTCLSLTPGKYYLRINFTSSQSYSGLSASLCIDYSNDNNINNDSHTYICNGCGYSKVEAHTFECDGFENGVHYEKCVDCDYRNSQCTNAVFSSIDSNNHSRICTDCEYTISTEPHNWIYTSINALYHEGHCADCGAVKTTQEAHSWTVASDPKYIKCSFCGHLMLKPTGGGGIIPVLPTKKDDIEEETK